MVYDFGAADVAAGGQGAPLAPLYHEALSRDLDGPLGIVNIGGISNVTWVDPAGDVPPVAFDTGPGNALLDDWVRSTLTCPLTGTESSARQDTVTALPSTSCWTILILERLRQNLSTVSISI